MAEKIESGRVKTFWGQVEVPRETDARYSVTDNSNPSLNNVLDR